MILPVNECVCELRSHNCNRVTVEWRLQRQRTRRCRRASVWERTCCSNCSEIIVATKTWSLQSLSVLWVSRERWTHFNVYSLEMLEILSVSGFPNTGKSSVINSLKRSKACDTGSTPGVTKYIKTNLNSCSTRHNSFNFLHQVCPNSAVGQTHQAVGQSWHCRSWRFQPNATHSSKLHQSEMIRCDCRFSHVLT